MEVHSDCSTLGRLKKIEHREDVGQEHSSFMKLSVSHEKEAEATEDILLFS